MKTYKFRYYDESGNACFREVTFPADADLLIGYDSRGEIYVGDVITFTEFGRPLSAQLSIDLVDNQGARYFIRDMEYSWLW